jgi:ribosomal protein S18 acetylase RimI-like enzyme
MTTTLRPTEPLQHAGDGTRSRRFQVCVNGRPVGAVRLTTHLEYGPAVARVEGLRIDEPDRGRGRGTVAALAAEEIARGWGCRSIEVSVPGDSATGLRLATALGYVLRSRNMAKRLDPEGSRSTLPVGRTVRPLTEAELGPWLTEVADHAAGALMERGVPEAEAYSKANLGNARFLPDGLATENTLISVLEDEGARVGTLWLGLWPHTAWVLNVEVDPGQRGRGHGRTLMLLADTRATEGGKDRIGLHVFADNTPAERLYTSLGYETTAYNLAKELG